MKNELAKKRIKELAQAEAQTLRSKVIEYSKKEAERNAVSQQLAILNRELASEQKTIDDNVDSILAIMQAAEMQFGSHTVITHFCQLLDLSVHDEVNTPYIFNMFKDALQKKMKNVEGED